MLGGRELSYASDIDVLFVLPGSVERRIDNLGLFTNKQSYLLQEVKGVLESSYPNTEMRADGQVVVVPFASYRLVLSVKTYGMFVMTSWRDCSWFCSRPAVKNQR